MSSGHEVGDDADLEEQRQFQQAREERVRAARRRRKILENANSRMEKVYSMQHWSSTAGGKEGERDDVRKTSCEEKDQRNHPPLAYTPPVIEDPPDELVVLTPPHQTRPPTPLPLSTMSRWNIVLGESRRTRFVVAVFTGVTAAVMCVAMGYCIPSMLCFVTSELSVLLWTLISALMTRKFPHQPQPLGTIAMVKVAIGVLYPPATKMLECLLQVGTLVAMVTQDLCVSVFSFIATSALLCLLLP